MSQAGALSESFEVLACVLELGTVAIAVRGLHRLRKRFGEDLDSFWKSHPDPLFRWLGHRRDALSRALVQTRGLVRRGAVALRIAKPRTIPITTAIAGSAFVGVAAGSVTVAALPKFEPGDDPGGQFDMLGEEVRIARQATVDLDRKLREIITANATRHEDEVRAVVEKIHEVALGDFGFAWLAVALLVVGIGFEIAATFV